jgi:hypothetical protein
MMLRANLFDETIAWSTMMARTVFITYGLTDDAFGRRNGYTLRK